MIVRAKFKVTSITRSQATRAKKDGSGYEPCEGQEIKLSPVTSNSPENEQFFRTTPSGEIRMFTVNEDAWKQFLLGGEYIVEFQAVGQTF